MTNALTKLEFNGTLLRIETIDSDPWFVLKDLMDAMESSTTPSQAATAACEALGDEVVIDYIVPDSAGRRQKTLLVSEAGATYLISRSNTSSGRMLNLFIHKEVLPSIRKTGGYEVSAHIPQNTLAAAKQLLLVAEEHESRLSSLEQRQEELEHRPMLGSPPEGVLFPKMRPDHMTVAQYSRETGIKTTRNERAGFSHRIAAYCRKVGIFYDQNGHRGIRYPIPVLQEFFRQ